MDVHASFDRTWPECHYIGTDHSALNTPQPQAQLSKVCTQTPEQISPGRCFISSGVEAYSDGIVGIMLPALVSATHRLHSKRHAL